AIIRGEQFSGNSIIRLAQKMDAGPILAQSRVPISDLETAGELHDRLAEDGAAVMDRVVQELSSGACPEKPQNESLATLAPKLSREAGRIDWSRPAKEIGWQIRGLYPWPGCRVRLLAENGEELDRLTLVRAKPAK